MMAVSVSGYVDAEGAVDAPMMPVQVIFADDLAGDGDVPVKTIDSPFGEVTYLPSLIELRDVEPRFERGPQPLGSSPLAW